MTTDEELMLETRNGSRAAFETLFGRYREPIWGFFRRRTPDAGRAEELAQDTFVAVLEAAARYERRGVFRSYLFGIAYNVLLADRRRATYRQTDRFEVEPPAPDEQLSYQEIADLRGTPLNTVRSQLFRARMVLKSALETRVPQALRTNHGGR